MKRTESATSPLDSEPRVKRAKADPADDVSEEMTKSSEDGSLKMKEPRRRKRGLYKGIVHQMEFYFGDANLAKSKFMHELMSQDEWVDLSVFLKFNKLVSMLEQSFGQASLDQLWKSLSQIQSELLEIRENDDGLKQIRRKLPVQVKENEEECTIYAENIPPNVSNDCLRRLFAQYGGVSYVSLPKFRNHDGNKGFGFIEFDGPEGAAKALEAFGAQESLIETEKPPEELQSIKAFIQENASDSLSADPTSDPKLAESEPDPRATAAKSETMASAAQPKKSKKKNRTRRRDEAPEPEVDLKLMSMQIMSKREWKQLRNKYLNQQRINFKAAKTQLKKAAQPVPNSHIKFDTTLKKEEKEEKVTSEPAKPTTVPGTVVKFTVLDPVGDRGQVKKLVKSAFIDGVEYVDVQIGAQEFHVRCSTAEQAQKLAGVACVGSGCVLEGEAETLYFAKVERDRAQKRSGTLPKETIRGRDKVLKKLDTAANKHKYFMDD